MPASKKSDFVITRAGLFKILDLKNQTGTKFEDLKNQTGTKFDAFERGKEEGKEEEGRVYKIGMESMGGKNFNDCITHKNLLF